MKIDAVFFLFMLSFTLVTSIKVISVDNIAPVSIIETQLVEIKMKLLTSDEPLSISVFIEKISEMLKNLEENQSKHVSINQKMSLQCADEEKFRKVEIADALSSYKASDDAVRRCEASLAAGKKFLPMLESSVSDYKNQIKYKTEERNVQHKQFLQLKQEWKDTISFLKGFSKKIEETSQGKSKSSFIQLNEDLIRHVAKIGRLENLIPIFLELEASVPITNTNSSSSIDKKSNSTKNMTRTIKAYNKLYKIKGTKTVPKETLNKTSSNKIKKDEIKNKINNTNRGSLTLNKNGSKNSTVANVTFNKNSEKLNITKSSVSPLKISALNATVSNQEKKIVPVSRTAGASINSGTKIVTVADSSINQSNINIPTNVTPSTNDTIIVEPDLKLDYLKRVVDKLIAQLVADSMQNDVDESNMQIAFEKLIIEFNKIISQIENNISKIKTQIEDMDMCIKTETVIMLTASAKKIRNEKLLALADTTCVDFVNSFVGATKSRYRQIEVMKDILAIIKKRFEEMPPELSKQLMNMDLQFKRYINTTEFKKYEEIAKTKFEDNQNGKALSNNVLSK